jgi:predicted DNA-binding antitoxin AbrB/MazE fold protein
MHTISATFEDGMFEPRQPLELPEHAEIRLTIEVLPTSPLTVGKLIEFLQLLPDLGDDRISFGADVGRRTRRP